MKKVALRFTIWDSEWVRFVACIFAALALIMFAVHARAGEIYTLEKVEATQQDQALVLRLSFDRPLALDNVPVEFINQTIQLSIPSATITHGRKQSLNVEDDLVSKVVAFAKGPDSLRGQIVLKAGQKAQQFESKIQVSQIDHVLEIRLLKDKSSKVSLQKLPVLKPVAVEAEASVSLDDQLQSTTLRAMQKAEISPSASPTPTDASEMAPLVDTAKEKEAQIPIASVSKEKGSSLPPMTRMLMSLALVVVVGFGVLFATRNYRRRGGSQLDATKIKIVNQHFLGPKKSLAIVRVAGESMLIGVTDHSISMIKSLSLLDEELPEITPSHFNSALSASYRDLDGAPLSLQAPHDEGDDFAMRGLAEIKDVVAKRLKSMGRNG